MSFRDLSIEDAYDTGSTVSGPVKDFYVPVLVESISYDRGTGYFSSTVLALAARGIAGLIHNGGKMRILTSPDLTKIDLEVLKESSMSQFNDAIAKQFEESLGDIDRLTDLFEKNHLRALSWLLKEERLEIKVVIPRELTNQEGIFHLKVGILTDQFGDVISFSGSNNESAGGWRHNVEEFKVFKSWVPGLQGFVNHDRALFDKYWNATDGSDFLSIALPEAVRHKLLSIAPDDIADLDLDEHSIEYESDKKNVPQLRKYQEDAITAWVGAGFKGILEMATGTGKTRTARECITTITQNSVSSITLIVAPQVHLAVQWAEVLSDLDPLLAYGGADWRIQLQEAQANVRLGLVKHCVVIAVQNTAATQEFRTEMKVLIDRCTKSMIVVDEAHGSGSEFFSQLLDSDYEMRLGLSATPYRWFDDDGTQKLLEYFGGVVFVFGIHEALTWVDSITGETPLCPYNYYPLFVNLEDEEMLQYAKLSRQITLASLMQNTKEDEDNLNILLIRRARIVKRAAQKIDQVEILVSKLGDLRGTLIYCSDIEQLELVAERLNNLGIIYRRFTGQEGTVAKTEYNGLSERGWILDDFTTGRVHVLLAVKCLDEGVDIPATRRGIILASSTNPREFIQRRGRLLRRSKGKVFADVYDLMVIPRASAIEDKAARSDETKLLRRELVRVDEFARDANNSGQIHATILEKMTEVLGAQ